MTESRQTQQFVAHFRFPGFDPMEGPVAVHKRLNPRGRVTSLVMVIALVSVVSLWSAPAGAQTPTSDPTYVTTSTTQAPVVKGVTCAFDVSAAQSGTFVNATVNNVAAGDEIRITFDGSTVASATSTGGAVTVRFAVPNLDPGTYQIAATGSGFTQPCGSGSFTVTAGAGVTPTTGGGQGNGGGGTLARTGAEIAPWVLAGLLLLAIGGFLVRQSRRRGFGTV